MKKLANIKILALFLLFLFTFFSYLVNQDVFNQADFKTTVIIQNFFPRTFDTPFSFFSLLGSFEIASIFLLIILLIYKKMKSIYVLLFFALFHIIELFGKTFLHHPGPPLSLVRYDIFFSFPSAGVSPGFAYPSGHSGRTIFISIILGFIISKSKFTKNTKYLLYFIIILFDILMLLSRVYLGEHWTTDVIGGGLLGASFSLLSLGFLLL